MRNSSLLALALYLCLPIATFAAIIHVPGDQPTIQAGINAAAEGDTVLVADGTYTGNGNRDLDFDGKAITLRSANGPENCIIDIAGTSTEDHRGFYFHSHEGRDSVVQGFTITNGYLTGYDWPMFYGGAIYCEYSSPTITGNIITGNFAALYGGALYFCHSASRIADNTITGNITNDAGGGIHTLAATLTITGNTISENVANFGGGGGVFLAGLTPTVSNNFISGNTVSNGQGGGIFCSNASGIISDNTITGNSADKGGGIRFAGEPPTITRNTITGNSAEEGGGIYLKSSLAMVSNTILWDNTAQTGKEIYFFGIAPPSILSIMYSDVDGGQASVHLDPDCTLDWGPGMIDADPLFASGPFGDRYLSQVAAGQAEDSPCVDAGDPAGGMVWGTTRTDHALDAGILDMGHHYPVDLPAALVTGPGPAYDNPTRVRVIPPLQDAVYECEFSAYGAQHYGVKVSCGDVTGDEKDEILTGAGPGDIYGPHVRGFQADGTPLPVLSFLAYGTHKYGVNVAAGDIDADGFDEIITGAGPGAVFGPHVRGWDYDGTGTVAAIPGVSYFAYGTPKWGVNVTAGDIDGDGYDEIVTGAGPGAVYGPHVRGWNVDGGAATSMPGCSFLAYGTHKYGVNVSCGDVDGDGIDEIITAPGPGAMFGAHVRGFEMNGTPLPGLSFFAWPPAEVRYGAEVFAGADLDGDGWNEIVVGQGPDPEASGEVKVFEYDGPAVILWFSLEAFPGMTHGTNVAAGRF